MAKPQTYDQIFFSCPFAGQQESQTTTQQRASGRPTCWTGSLQTIDNEVAALPADLRRRNLVMETDIDTQCLMAKLNDVQCHEAAAFEEGKDKLGGLHLISVQQGEDDDRAGFWLLREIPSVI